MGFYPEGTPNPAFASNSTTALVSKQQVIS